MNCSWQLGRIFGIDIKLHLTFFILLIWVDFQPPQMAALA